MLQTATEVGQKVFVVACVGAMMRRRKGSVDLLAHFVRCAPPRQARLSAMHSPLLVCVHCSVCAAA